jgi:hypothetical protein
VWRRCTITHQAVALAGHLQYREAGGNLVKADTCGHGRILVERVGAPLRYAVTLTGALPHLNCSHAPECCLIRIAPQRCSRCCIGGGGYGAHQHGDTG